MLRQRKKNIILFSQIQYFEFQIFNTIQTHTKSKHASLNMNHFEEENDPLSRILERIDKNFEKNNISHEISTTSLIENDRKDLDVIK